MLNFANDCPLYSYPYIYTYISESIASQILLLSRILMLSLKLCAFHCPCQQRLTVHQLEAQKTRLHLQTVFASFHGQSFPNHHQIEKIRNLISPLQCWRKHPLTHCYQTFFGCLVDFPVFSKFQNEHCLWLLLLWAGLFFVKQVSGLRMLT